MNDSAQQPPRDVQAVDVPFRDERTSDRPPAGEGPELELPPRRRFARLRRIFGPIFTKELRVAARRRRTYWLRTSYLIFFALFVVIAWGSAVASLDYYGGPRILAFSRIAPSLLMTTGWVQLFGLTLVAPVLTAGSIAEEQVRRTLPALMTTPITPWQIVAGKLASRMVQLLLLAALSLPVLATVQVYGGVEPYTVVATVSLAMASALFAAALGMLQSTFTRKVHVALLNTYFILIGLWGAVPALCMCIVASARSPEGFALLPLINPFVSLFALQNAMEGGRTASSVGWGAAVWIPCTVVLSIGALLLAAGATARVRRIARGISGDGTPVPGPMPYPGSVAPPPHPVPPVGPASAGAAPAAPSAAPPPPSGFGRLMAHAFDVNATSAPTLPPRSPKQPGRTSAGTAEPSAGGSDAAGRPAVSEEAAARDDAARLVPIEVVDPAEEPVDVLVPSTPASKAPPLAPVGPYGPPLRLGPTPTSRPSRRVGDNPVLWRELSQRVVGRTAGWWVALVLLGLLLLIVYAYAGSQDAFQFGGFHGAMTAIYLFFLLLEAAVFAAPCITTEKESSSWPILLSTALSGGQIVWSKTAGVLRRLVPISLLLVGHVLLFVVAGVLRPLALFHTLLIIAAFVPFLVAVGICLSLVQKRTTSAIAGTMLAALFLWALLPLFVSLIPDAAGMGPAMFYINPFAWMFTSAAGGTTAGSGFLWGESTYVLPHGLAEAGAFTAALGLTYVGHLVVTVLLFSFAAVRFNRLTGRTS